MNKLFVTVLLLAAFLSAVAQPPPPELVPESAFPDYRFSRPDSLPHGTPWRPSSDGPPRSVLANPSVSMTSVVTIPRENLPRKIDLPVGGVYRGTHVWISNGQAWNWGPYPDAWLDARTLSFPASR